MQTLTSDLLGQNLFSFTKLTDSGLNFTNFGDAAINDRGVVAFSAAKASASQLSGIYTSNGRQTTTVIEQSGLADLFRNPVGNVGSVPSDAQSVQYSFGNDVAINNNGDVLFDAKANFLAGTTNTTIDGLFLKKGTSITSVGGIQSFAQAGIRQTATFTGFGLNDSDQVVYGVDTTVNNGRQFENTQIVFQGSAIASGYNGPGAPSSRVYDPIITNNGPVYYASSGQTLNNGNVTDVSNVYRLAPGATTPTALSPQRLTIEGLSANNSGTVVFSGSLASGESGVFQLNSSGSIKKISDSGTNPFINDYGIVAYQPAQGSTSGGISVTVPVLNNLTRSVIAPGDVLFGSTVSSVKLDGINRSGQIAFVATFSDGTSGVFRADPHLRLNLNQNLTFTGADLAEALA